MFSLPRIWLLSVSGTSRISHRRDTDPLESNPVFCIDSRNIWSGRGRYCSTVTQQFLPDCGLCVPCEKYIRISIGRSRGMPWVPPPHLQFKILVFFFKFSKFYLFIYLFILENWQNCMLAPARVSAHNGGF